MLEEVLGSPWVNTREMHYDPEQKRLFWPLLFHEQSLGFLVLFGFSHIPDSKEQQWLKRFTEIALEMTALRKQVRLDPVTGFFHETAFRKVVAQVLKEGIKNKGEQKPEKLSLAEGRSNQKMILGFLSLQPKASGGPGLSSPPDTIPLTWIRAIKDQFPAGTILAAVRHHPLIVGFIIPEMEGEGQPLSPPWSNLAELQARFEYHLGWAWHDLRGQESFQGNPSRFAMMSRWWDQAWTALESARTMGPNTALNYDEILFRAGRVLDILPGHRIVINQGEKAGVEFFMRFSIVEEGEEKPEKGLAVPLDIQENLCVAEMIYLQESGLSIQKNDRVRLVTSPVRPMEGLQDAIVSPNGPLRSFQMFQQKLRQALKESEKFSLLIGRLDDFNERLKTWGEQSLLEIRKEMNKSLEEKMPQKGIFGPYGRDGFILYLPDAGRDEAGDWAKGLIEGFKKNLNISISLGLAYFPLAPFHKGEVLDNAVKALDHLAFLGPGSLVVFDSVTLNISGDKYYGRGELEEAVRDYERALILDPENSNALNSLGVTYANQGRLQPAVEAFQRVLQLSGDDFMASFNLGFALAGLGRAQEAIQVWEELARRSETDFDLAYHLGRLYREAKAYDRAYEWFRKAEEAPNKKGAIYRALGEIEELREKYKEAMIWYKKALKNNPQNAFCLSRLGSLYLQQGESIRVALSLCQQATRIEPDMGIYWMNLGKALFRNGSPQKATEAFQKALDKGGPMKELYRLLGLSFRTLGRHQTAQEFFIKALKQDPENQELQGYLKEESL
jgi:tetratricopeptide (TPR) repeat protein